ncbi:MAG TPA: DUF2950 domain-containing protein [Paraburkholderia sp.]|jgi:hypothetical protein|nr:DUF2950 domain-containing protein [Paraburkholderia sp.]
MIRFAQSSTQGNGTSKPARAAASAAARSPASRGSSFVAKAALLGALSFAAGQSHAQAIYPTPDAAADALQQALAIHDTDAVRKVLGADYKQYIPTDIDEDDVYAFLAAYAKHHEIVDDGKGTAHLQAGDAGWTLPVPIRQTKAGWHFDVREGHDELTIRRIGRNELAAMQTVLAIGDAQRDFARAKGGVYAQRFISHPGKQDGLYWPTAEGEPDSPLGDLASVMDPTAPANQAYHGYRYRILSAQGAHAPGGARSYLDNGAMRGGYAVIAWPAAYGQTGVMSFISGSDGKVYQHDFGPQSATAAARIRAYDPGPDWQAVPDAQLAGPQ